MVQIKKYVEESVFAGYATLGITVTSNLDSVLGETLQKIKLDVEGRLVKFTTIHGMVLSYVVKRLLLSVIMELGIFRTFETDFSNFLMEWLDNCSANGYCEDFILGRYTKC
jgi:hypothetical protein